MAKGQTMGGRLERDELDEFVDEQLKDPDFRGAYEDAAARSRLLRELVVARTRMALTQTDVAKCMGTTQSAVSEFEAATTDPQLSTLQRYARAVCGELRTYFVPACTQPISIVLSRKWASGPSITGSAEFAVPCSFDFQGLVTYSSHSDEAALAR